MDQIYREYSEKYKHILHYAGIMKKENVLFENQEIIVLKDVKEKRVVFIIKLHML